MWHRLAVVGCNDPRDTKLGHPRLFYDVVPLLAYTRWPRFPVTATTILQPWRSNEGRIFISIFIRLARLSPARKQKPRDAPGTRTIRSIAPFPFRHIKFLPAKAFISVKTFFYAFTTVKIYFFVRQSNVRALQRISDISFFRFLFIENFNII